DPARPRDLPAGLDDVDRVDDANRFAGLHDTHLRVGEVLILQHEPPELLDVHHERVVAELRAAADLHVTDADRADLEPHRPHPSPNRGSELGPRTRTGALRTRVHSSSWCRRSP